MRIKCLAVIIISLFLFSLTACGNTEKTINTVDTVNTQESIQGTSTAGIETVMTNAEEPSGTNIKEENARNPWVKKKEMPVKLFTQRAAVIHDKIYVLGTTKDFMDYNDLYEYDPLADNWSKKSPSIAGEGTIISGGSLAVFNGKLYTFGGGILKSDNSFEATYNVQEYDPQTDKWIHKGELPDQNYAFGAATVNDKIYVVGGELSVLDEYDPVMNKWVSKSKPPMYYQDAGVIAVNDRIYDISGAGSSLVSEYDPETDKWTMKSKPIITQRIHLFPVAVNNLIFAVNGIKIRGMKHSNDVEVYDPVKDEWTARSKAPVATYCSGTAVVNGKIYLIGGMLDGENAGPSFDVYEYDPALDK